MFVQQIYFISSRISVIKFSFFGTYEQSCVGSIFLDKSFVQIVFQYPRSKVTDSLNYLSKISFFTNFVYVSQNSEWSRCCFSP